MMRPGPARAAAAGLLLAAAGGAAVAAGAASRWAERAATGPDEPRVTALFPGNAPTLVLAADRSCHACRRALRDFDELGDLGAAGVQTAVRVRYADAAADSLFAALGPGMVPVYVVVDADGRLAAAHRGYLPPGRLRAWVRDALLAPRGGGVLCLTDGVPLATMRGSFPGVAPGWRRATGMRAEVTGRRSGVPARGREAGRGRCRTSFAPGALSAHAASFRRRSPDSLPASLPVFGPAFPPRSRRSAPRTSS